MRRLSLAAAAILFVVMALSAQVQGREGVQNLGQTGSISGRVVTDGFPENQEQFAFSLIRVDKPQPVVFDEFPGITIITDFQGNFSRGGLADGDYFLVASPAFSDRVIRGMPAAVDAVAFGENLASAALRISILDGQAVEGIEIVVKLNLDGPIVDDFGPLSPPNDIAAPSAGAGGQVAHGAGGSAGAYIGLGVAVAALALFAGGTAYRLRGRRAP